MGGRCVILGTSLVFGLKTDGSEQLSTQTPTVRMLNGHDDRFVISCPTDVSIWRPIVEHGNQVFTQELILTSALRQEISLGEAEFQVPGSF